MNKTTTESVTEAATEFCGDVNQCVRKNPGSAIVVAVGVGLAIGLIVRALRPEPEPQHRVARMLENLERRVRHATEPALRRAGAFATEAAETVRERAQDGGAVVEGFLKGARCQLRKMFS